MKTPKKLDVFEIPLKGINLVESSAGTGKTYNIAGLYVRAVAEYGFTPQQILVVTFTKAATQELRERIGSKLKDALHVLTSDATTDDYFLNQFKSAYQGNSFAVSNLEKALKSFDLSQISTIHGFCQQALQEYIFESNNRFNIEYSNNINDLLTEAADDLWRSYMHSKSTEDEAHTLIQNYLFDSVKSPDNLKKILIQKTGKPYLSYSTAHSNNAFTDFANTWFALEKRVLNVLSIDEINHLLEFDGLKGGSYQPTRKQKMLDQFNQWIANQSIPFRKWEKDELTNIELLTPNGMKLNKNYSAPNHELLNAFEELLNFNLNEGIERIFIKLSVEFETLVSEKKNESRLGSFDDILIGMMEAVKRPAMKEKIRDAYPLALVDEFQDTDPIQLEIFKEIYSGFQDGGLFMIGDPKQSIYRFRGADIESYLSIRRSENVNIYQLGENFRSSASLVNAVNELFFSGENETMPGDIPFYPSAAHKKDDEFILPETFNPAAIQFAVPGASVEHVKNKEEGESYSIDFTASEIAHLLQAGADNTAKIRTGEQWRGVQPRDISVLVHSHRDADKIKRALLRKGIKSVTNSKLNVFQTNECGFIIDFVSLLKNPGYAPYLKNFLFSNYLGWPLSKIKELEENEQGFTEIMITLESLKFRFERFGFSSTFQSFLNLPLAFSDGKECTVEERILSLDQNERRYTNLIHLSELISQHERSHKTGAEGLVKWLLKEKESQVEENQIRLESDDNLVQILTIHTSKGLEFPIVFCPFLWNYLYKKGKSPFVYHSSSTDFMIDFSGLNESEATQAVRKEEIAEKVRLTYVALTRARYRCYIQLMPYTNYQKDSNHGPLSFILGSQEDKSAFKNGNGITPTLHIRKAEQLLEQHPELFNTAQTNPFYGVLNLNETSAELNQARKILRNDFSQPSWFVTSYSGLKKQRVETVSEFFDDRFPDVDTTTPEISNDFDIFNFPRGARSGVLMHALFENLSFPDFEKKAGKMIQDILLNEGIDSKFHHALFVMMQNTLSKKLPHSNAVLMEKGTETCMKEMEFYFPLKHADIDEITSIIDEKNPVSSSSIQAYMTGFIDLLFEHEGKYYILDYKSDFLGAHPSDYEPEKLRQAIFKSGYHYQYHIYSVAVYRALKRLLGADFDFDTHFGGCYYLYLRGIQHGEGAEGVFFAKPKLKVVEALDNYFRGMNA